MIKLGCEKESYSIQLFLSYKLLITILYIQCLCHLSLLKVWLNSFLRHKEWMTWGFEPRLFNLGCKQRKF
jgi:hypothetical protein